MQLRRRLQPKSTFKKPKTPKKKSSKYVKMDKLTQTSKNSNDSFPFYLDTNDEFTICNLKLEGSESLLDMSLTSYSSIASQERNNAFHQWLMSEQKNPEVPNFQSRLEKLIWLQEQRNIGVYVICDNCEKLRYIKDIVDPLEFPDKWFCYMSNDPAQNSCELPRIHMKSFKLDELINNKYNAGSIVWGKVIGHPWLPAIVDDDPDYETFFYTGDEENPDDPTEYHLTFLGKKVQRAWCKTNKIKPFAEDPYKVIELKFKKHRTAMEEARKDAFEALKLPLLNRLKRFSFISRWNKPLL